MICIIPARGGSTRIPRKNIKDFHGKPIIAYSIEMALESKLFSEVVVSTDDDEIARVARDYGASIFKRSAATSQNDVGTQTVAREVLMKKESGVYACVLYPTSPLLSMGSLVHGFWVLMANGHPYVYSTYRNGEDAGNFYFGFTESFINDVPLEGNSLKMPIPYPCDINTMADWTKAEHIYEEIHGHKKSLVG